MWTATLVILLLNSVVFKLRISHGVTASCLYKRRFSSKQKGLSEKPKTHLFNEAFTCFLSAVSLYFFYLTFLLIDNLKPFKISTLKNAHWFGTHIVIPFEQCWEQAKLPFKPIQRVLNGGYTTHWCILHSRMVSNGECTTQWVIIQMHWILVGKYWAFMDGWFR